MGGCEAGAIAVKQFAYSEFKNLCVWVKESGGQGALYRSRHELVFVFKNGTAKHRNNIQLGQYGRYRTNVWEYPRVRFGDGDEQLAGLHPTIKPAAMVADAILDATSRNDVVLDPFVGSGTTVIAAERTGRICYGLELDPVYVDTIIRRWQAFTGKSTVHGASGLSFDEREKEVGHVALPPENPWGSRQPREIAATAFLLGGRGTPRAMHRCTK
jgi:DNA modification methylase